MKETKVRKHPRRKKTGRTTVKRHQRRRKDKSSINNKSMGRTRFLRRKVEFKKTSYSSIDEIHQDYIDDADYEHPIPFTTNPKSADMEMVLDIGNGSREHHRIWNQGSRWKIESHIDKYSPTEKPIKHLTEDVIKPELQPRLRQKNFDDTQIIYLDKK